MNTRWLLPLASGLLLAGCAAGLKPEGSPPRPETVGRILLRLPPENLSERGSRLDADRLAAAISGNLAAWGYPVTTDASVDHSHVMEAKVGAVESGGTPTGFSFSVGDSDPRARGFQKAEVVTVVCTLRAIRRPTENAYLKEPFVADEVLKRGARAKGEQALFDAYVDHIGTTCFNLLGELKIRRRPDPPLTPGSPAGTWFPEVRIEVTDQGSTPPPASSPATGGRPRPAEQPSDNLNPPVRTETKQGETRKQMIIHNQGSPIILEFGYERK